jgi:hypothetical protein
MPTAGHTAKQNGCCRTASANCVRQRTVPSLFRGSGTSQFYTRGSDCVQSRSSSCASRRRSDENTRSRASLNRLSRNCANWEKMFSSIRPQRRGRQLIFAIPHGQLQSTCPRHWFSTAREPGRVFVAIDDKGGLVGFCSLSLLTLAIKDLSDEIARKLCRYDAIPARPHRSACP